MAIKRSAIKLGKILGMVSLLAIVVFGVWCATYPGPDDPKGFLYIGWRFGFPTLDPDRALGTMVGDIHREGLVIGKTKDQLIKRFGYLTAPEKASEYVKYCYFSSPYYGKQFLILRNSNWMVLMKDGRATDLILVKGC